MKRHSEDQIDFELRKLFRELPLEEPKKDFAREVMRQIELSVENSTFRYTPVFSPYAWILVALLCLLFLGLGLTAGEGGSFLSYTFDPLTKLRDLSLSDYLPRLNRTDVLLYATLALIICFSLQVYWFGSYRVKNGDLTL